MSSFPISAYGFMRPLLFMLDAERAHELALANLRFISRQTLPLSMLKKSYGDCVPELPTRCMGLDFKHPLGLAAGLDKHAEAIDAFIAMGFSAVEAGTVTPQPQAGNDKPRLFRLAKDQALINRMGFNSQGVDQFLQNLKHHRSPGILGINIGKNATTSIEDAHADYVSALQKLYGSADYISVNISSPNTKSLRDLQNANHLDGLLGKLKVAHSKCVQVHDRHVPIALKISPDLEDDEIETIAELVLSYQFDAVIATNTTISRPADLQDKHQEETGGLSGRPLKQLSTDCISKFYNRLQGQVQIIGVGGIQNADDAWNKLIAGADYLQLYTQFIYDGPLLIKNIVKGIKQKLDQHGFEDIATAMNELRTKQ